VKESELRLCASHARTCASTAKTFADLVVDPSNLRRGMPLPSILLSAGSRRPSFVLMLSLLYPAYSYALVRLTNAPIGMHVNFPRPIVTSKHPNFISSLSSASLVSGPQSGKRASPVMRYVINEAIEDG
jgi:hypothetical protein